MDIVSRLKIFMTSLDMTSTQFADACRIPRPSMSQLLNGRNKKVSDEFVTKIHEAFPRLSILWLMFGEGEMDTASNIQFSEPQNGEKMATSASQSFEFQPTADSTYSQNFNTNFSPNKLDSISDGLFAENITPNPSQSPTEQRNTQSAAPAISSLKIEAPSSKRITNIVVFYDDNSFESFNPATIQ